MTETVMRLRLNRPWTDEDDEALRSMAAANKSLFAIAARVKRTAAATRMRAMLIGVKYETAAKQRKRVGLKANERMLNPVGS